ncbi:glycine receptor subunit alpha-2-like isoform X2 [Macrobrachium nipponense]|uniref:glycine receptor subunit alpha-2-like isoform X2 n=1 Tax=Macrobrachium nipponense TaxID=159736 RepID=UPI0030C87A20
MTLTSNESGILAVSDPGPLHGYPIGRRRWTIEGDRCQNGEVTLLLTLCDESQYTCDDGSCVPYEQRCDHKTQCKDFSDEKGCSVIVLPQGYSMEIPPPVSSDDPLELSFCQEIISVREVDIAEFRVQIDVRQKVKWRDTRLTFRNLRPGNFSNRVKLSEGLWLPEFYIESGDQSLADSNVKTSFLFVQLNSNPQDKNATSQDKLFDGKENTIVMIQRSTISFSCHCQFCLLRYPFDTQSCSVLYSEVNAVQHINYTIESVSFEGNRKLLEYMVTGVTAELMRRGEVEVIKDRIMVSLTSLLVLTGLLTQTSQSVPKTTYMKTIDVWYAALIIFDFCIVVTLAVVEFLHCQEAKSNPSEALRDTEHFQRLLNAACSDGKKGNVIPVIQNFIEEAAPKNDGKSRALLVNKCAIMVFPVVGVLFVSFFLCLAFQII